MKSDDVVGRVKTYEAIIKGANIPEPGIPESFKVLLKEFQSLGLDVRLLDENGEECKMSESSETPNPDLKDVIEGDGSTFEDEEDTEGFGEIENDEYVDVEVGDDPYFDDEI